MSRWSDLATRYAQNIRMGENGCWEWQGARNSVGYGVIHGEGRRQYAHRLSWRYFKVSPRHLFLGTKADNTRDMWSKGRQGGDPARNANKDRCKCHELPLNEKRRCPRNYRNSLTRSEAQSLRWRQMDPEQAFAIRQRQWATRRATA